VNGVVTAVGDPAGERRRQLRVYEERRESWSVERWTAHRLERSS